MAHEIEVRNGRAMMFYAGETPWHGLGTAVEEAVTSEEALKLADLDWEVKLGPLYGPGRKHPQRIPHLQAIYRSDDLRVLGVATQRYVPLQNREAFEFVDSLVADRVARYESAGSLLGGSRVWLLARLDKDVRIAGEEYRPYMLFQAFHDGRNSVRMTPTAVRAVCNNTVEMAFRGSDSTIRIVHSKNMKAKLEEAKRALNVTTEGMRRLKALLETAAEYRISEPQVEVVRSELFGPLDDATPTQRRKAIETFMAIYEAEKALNGATAYSLVNAVTGYADHATRYIGDANKKLESRFQATFDSWREPYRMKAKALNAVVDMLKEDAPIAS